MADSSITDGVFVKMGDSGVVSVGVLPEDTPYDGTAAGAAFPSNITIARCHFGQVRQIRGARYPCLVRM